MENVKSGDFFPRTPIGEATLYVPGYLIDTYESTSPWSGFGTITFIPTLGDSNANGTVNIADAVNTANYAVGLAVEDFNFEVADVNKDKRITLADASGTVTLLLEQPVAAACRPFSGSSASDACDRLVLDSRAAAESGTNSVAVGLDNTVDYVALQADVTVPEGMTLVSVKPGRRVGAGHSLVTKRMDDRTMRIVLFSPDNAAFIDNGESLFELAVTSGSTVSGDIAISNIIAADAQAREYMLRAADIRISGTTGLDAANVDGIRICPADKSIRVCNAAGRDVAIYSAGGRLVSRFTATSDLESCRVAAGLYIVAAGDFRTTVIVK